MFFFFSSLFPVLSRSLVNFDGAAGKRDSAHRILAISRLLRCLTSIRKTAERLLVAAARIIDWRCGARNILDVQIRSNYA